MTQRSAGAGYTLWRLAAALALPVADVALLVGLNGLGLAIGVSSGWLVGLLAAVALNIGLLRWWGRRLGVSGGVIAAAIVTSIVAAVFALVILAVVAIAPALS